MRHEYLLRFDGVRQGTNKVYMTCTGVGYDAALSGPIWRLYAESRPEGYLPPAAML